MKKHAPPFDGPCIQNAPHLSKDKRGIITSALSKLVGFGTLLGKAGCRGVIGPFPQPLLIRYEIRDLPQNILTYLANLSTESFGKMEIFGFSNIFRFCCIKKATGNATNALFPPISRR
jgi:hypothetical protein